MSAALTNKQLFFCVFICSIIFWYKFGLLVYFQVQKTYFPYCIFYTVISYIHFTKRIYLCVTLRMSFIFFKFTPKNNCRYPSKHFSFLIFCLNICTINTHTNECILLYFTRHDYDLMPGRCWRCKQWIMYLNLMFRENLIIIFPLISLISFKAEMMLCNIKKCPQSHQFLFIHLL